MPGLPGLPSEKRHVIAEKPTRHLGWYIWNWGTMYGLKIQTGVSSACNHKRVNEMNLGDWIQSNRPGFRTSALPYTICVTLSELLSHSGTHFSDLWLDIIIKTSITVLSTWWVLNYDSSSSTSYSGKWNKIPLPCEPRVSTAVPASYPQYSVEWVFNKWLLNKWI